MRAFGLMGLAGVEPATSPLSGVRSNQLSYEPACNALQHKALHLPATQLPNAGAEEIIQFLKIIETQSDKKTTRSAGGQLTANSTAPASESQSQSSDTSSQAPLLRSSLPRFYALPWKIL